MHFSDSTTALHFLSSPLVPPFAIRRNLTTHCMEAFEFLYTVWPQKRDCCRKKIQYICDSTYLSYMNIRHNARASLARLADNQTGTLILSYPGHDVSTIFYEIETRRNFNAIATNGWIILFQHQETEIAPELIFYAHIKNGEIDQQLGLDTIKATMFTGFIRGLIGYPKSFPLENKTLRPGKKAFYAGEHYINDTSFAIDLLHDPLFKPT